jgi:hypothetical protein
MSAKLSALIFAEVRQSHLPQIDFGKSHRCPVPSRFCRAVHLINEHTNPLIDMMAGRSMSSSRNKLCNQTSVDAAWIRLKRVCRVRFVNGRTERDSS